MQVRRKGGKKASLEGKQEEVAELGWAVEHHHPCSAHLCLLQSPWPCSGNGGMASWQGLIFLSCFPTEKDIFFLTSHFHMKMSVRKKKRGILVEFLFLLLSTVSFPLGSPFPHCQLSRQGFNHHFQNTGMKVPCQL